MLIVEDLLSADILALVDEVVARGKFADGSRSASGNAREVKNNLQLSRRESDPTLAKKIQQMDQALMTALMSNDAVRHGVWPRMVASPPIISRYGEGMEYGIHTDIPVMGRTNLIRVDISCTIFLSEPESYDGGELVLVAPEGERTFKLARGGAIVYPTHYSHRVAKVTRGERLAVVTFMQSRIPDAGKRSILADLDSAQRAFASTDPDGEAIETLTRGYYNLVRRWTEL